MLLKLNQDFVQPHIPNKLFNELKLCSSLPVPLILEKVTLRHPSPGSLIITAREIVSFASFVSLHSASWDDSP
jgi:hypothetical protein